MERIFRVHYRIEINSNGNSTLRAVYLAKDFHFFYIDNLIEFFHI